MVYEAFTYVFEALCSVFKSSSVYETPSVFESVMLMHENFLSSEAVSSAFEFFLSVFKAFISVLQALSSMFGSF